MNNADFWASIHGIIAAGFTPECLQKLDGYAEQFISGKLVYQRFSPQEQHGCAAGGTTNVIASLLAGAENSSDSDVKEALSEFQRECQLGARQETVIERGASAVGTGIKDQANNLAPIPKMPCAYTQKTLRLYPKRLVPIRKIGGTPLTGMPPIYM